MREDFMLPFEYETMMESSKWAKEIPELNFQPDWNIRIIPPMGGAVVRFRVSKGDSVVSVYLDCYDRLGIFGAPYWEIYPHYGDTFRCAMNDTVDLLKAIGEGLEHPEE